MLGWTQLKGGGAVLGVDTAEGMWCSVEGGHS